MSKTIPESKLISVEHKSLIGTKTSGQRVQKSGGLESVSDKKIRTLERNRNISPAPFQVDSTDSDEEDHNHGFHQVISSHKSSSKKTGSNNLHKNSKNSQKSSLKSEPTVKTDKMRSVSQEIRSAFSLATEFKKLK